jgi:hypothetical protein
VFRSAQQMVLEPSPKARATATEPPGRPGAARDNSKRKSTGKIAYARMALMPAFDEHRDELEHYETMMGPQRGRLAVALDLLTNALVLVGQHGVYCHTNRDPDVPVMDIRIIQAEIGKAKELMQSVMEAMRAERDKKG